MRRIATALCILWGLSLVGCGSNPPPPKAAPVPKAAVTPESEKPVAEKPTKEPTITSAQATELSEQLKPLGIHFFYWGSGAKILIESREALDDKGRLKAELVERLGKLRGVPCWFYTDTRVAATDALVAQAGEMPFVVLVQFEITNELTDAAIDGLVKSTTIKDISIAKNSKITPAGFAKLAKLPQVEKLSIADPVDGAFFTAISKHPKLKDLHLWEEAAVTEEALGKLAGLPALTKFFVATNQQTAISGTGMAFLKSCPKLEEIRVNSLASLTDAATAPLAGLPELKEVILYAGTELKITDESLKALGQIPKLEKLELARAPKVSDAGIAHLTGLKQLKDLRISYFDGLTDASLDSLSKIPSLEVLRIEDCAITDAGLEKLAALPNLKEFRFSGEKITDAGVKKFEASRKK